jgi:hypothetical protein
MVPAVVAPMSAVAARPRPAGLLNCAQVLKARPRTFTLACGDGNVGLTSLRWSRFGGAGARATGLFVANECLPNCAQGRFFRRKVTVLATRPGLFGGKRTYSRLSLTGKHGTSLGRYGIDADGPYTLQR